MLQLLQTICNASHLLVSVYLYIGLSPRRVGDVFEGGAGGGQKACALRKELGDLERVEKSLDELIHSSTAQLKQLTEHEDNQRYPLHAAVCLCIRFFGGLLALVALANVLLISAAVLNLDPRAVHWAM